MQDNVRTIIQRTMFTGPIPRIVPGMYLDADQAMVATTRTTLRLVRGTKVSTNTYFGRFAASYWQRHTSVSAVRLEFDYEIADAARLRVEINASDASGRTRPIDVIELSGTDHAAIDIEVDRFVDGGAIWFDATAIDGDVELSDVVWTRPAGQPGRGVSVVICTHNRPREAIATVLSMALDPLVAECISSIHLVDQGTDRVDAQPRFAELTESLGPKLHYLTQPNLGGAGGFTRGIHELTRSGTCDTNIIVMDDDIVCEPESVLRIWAFANATDQPVLVGAQMLLLSETYRVHMTGEWEDLAQLNAGQPSAQGKRGLNALENQQDARVDAGWNGWWTCLLPPESVDKAGLSLPLFFQWDDIEFGIRARHSGFPTVTLPNAGVWHADFHLKDYDDWSRYFSFRNALIVSAIHTAFDGPAVAKVVAELIARHIAAMQYGLAATFLLAVRDFLAGPSILQDGGQSKLAELAELRGRYPDTQLRSAVQVGAESDPNTQIVTRGPKPQEDKLLRVLAKRVVKQGLGRVSPAPVAIGANDAQWWHVALYSAATVTDASQRGVRVRRRDKNTAMRLGRQLAQLYWQLRRHGHDVAEQWRVAVPDLTGRENWQRLFDGD